MNLKFDILVSSFTFKFNSYHYIVAAPKGAKVDVLVSANGGSKVGLYSSSLTQPKLESAWFQPLKLKM